MAKQKFKGFKQVLQSVYDNTDPNVRMCYMWLVREDENDIYGDIYMGNRRYGTTRPNQEGSIHFEVYPSLNDIATPSNSVLYLIGPDTSAQGDQYEEYIYYNENFVKIGDTSIDLSGYATTEQLTNGLNGKQPTIDANHKLDYSLLDNTPTIPAAQVQSDWNQSDNTQVDFIKNKPTIPTVPTISTDIEADKTDNTKTASPKAVYDAMSEDEEVTAAALCELEEKKLDKDKLVDTYNSYVANAHEKAASSYALYNFYRQIVTDEEILATALNNLNALGILASAIAPLYKVGTRTFAVDDCCIYESQFYRCTTAVTFPEPFDPTKWERTNAYTVIMSRIKTMQGATASAAGSAGYAPAPAAGDNEKFLRGDGTWQNVSVPQEIMNLIYAGL